MSATIVKFSFTPIGIKSSYGMSVICCIIHSFAKYKILTVSSNTSVNFGGISFGTSEIKWG